MTMRIAEYGIVHARADGCFINSNLKFIYVTPNLIKKDIIKFVKYNSTMAMQVSANVDAEQVKSFRDFLTSYNKLSEICFVDCITDFTTRDVKAKEEKCALNCMEKYLKMNQRVSQRFQEFQMIANENVLAAEKKLARN